MFKAEIFGVRKMMNHTELGFSKERELLCHSISWMEVKVEFLLKQTKYHETMF